MSEIVIPAPIDCVWKGHYRDLPQERWEWMAGWCFYQDAGKYGAHGELNPARGDRLPIVVMCPCRDVPGVGIVGIPFCIDAPATSDAGYWNVTVDMESLVVGAKPNITVNPSIHLVGLWHGWLQDGVLHQ